MFPLLPISRGTRRWLALSISLLLIAAPVLPVQSFAPGPFVLTGGPVSENFAANSIVGQFQVQNAGSETFTYALTAGYGDNALFTIKDSSNGRLWNTAKFDYEVKTSYALQASASGSQGSHFTQTFTLQIQNADDNRPTDIVFAPEPVTVRENQGPRLISTMTTVDADGAGFAHTYTLSGPGAAYFALHPGGQLWSATSFDYEALPPPQALTITITSSDSAGAWRSETFPVWIINAADQPPTGLALSGSHRLERGAPAGTFIGTFTTTDLDLPSPGDSFTYSLVGSNCPGSSKFAIQGDRLLVNADLRFTAQPYITLCVQVTDSAGLIYPSNGQGRALDIVLEGAVLTLDHRLYLPTVRR